MNSPQDALHTTTMDDSPMNIDAVAGSASRDEKCIAPNEITPATATSNSMQHLCVKDSRSEEPVVDALPAEVQFRSDAIGILRKEVVLSDEQRSAAMPLTLQVLGVQPIVTQPNCFYVTVSNGVQFYKCKLDSKLNHLIEEEKLVKGVLLSVEHFLCHKRAVCRDGSPTTELVVISHASVAYEGKAFAVQGPAELWSAYETASGKGTGLNKRKLEEANGDINGGDGANGNPNANAVLGLAATLEQQSKRAKEQHNISNNNKGANTGGANGKSGGNVEPIKTVSFSELRANSTRWEVYCRLMFKGPLLPNRNNTYRFTATLMDSNNHEVKVTFFQNVQRYHKMLHVGNLYRCEGFKVEGADNYNTLSKVIRIVPSTASAANAASSTGMDSENDGSALNYKYINGTPLQLVTQPQCKMDPVDEAQQTLRISPHGGQFVPISELKAAFQSQLQQQNGNSNGNQKAPAYAADVLGIVLSVSELIESTSSFRSDDNGNSKSSFRRVVRLVDTSGLAVDVTLWNPFAQPLDETKLIPGKTVLVVLRASVSSYNGVSLKTDQNYSRLYINPASAFCPEADQVLQWYQSVGMLLQESAEFDCITDANFQGNEYKPMAASKYDHSTIALLPSLSSVEDTGLGTIRDQEDRCFVLARVKGFNCNVDRPPWYPACSNPQCRYARVQLNEGSAQEEYYCKKGNHLIRNPVLRYNARATLVDASGILRFVQFWHDDMFKVLNNIKAEDLKTVLETQGEKPFIDLLENSYTKQWKFLLSITGKEWKPNSYNSSSNNNTNGDDESSSMDVVPSEDGSGQQQQQQPAEPEIRRDIVVRTTVEVSYDDQAKLLEQMPKGNRASHEEEWAGTDSGSYQFSEGSNSAHYSGSFLNNNNTPASEAFTV
jgi:hypothetical protein